MNYKILLAILLLFTACEKTDDGAPAPTGGPLQNLVTDPAQGLPGTFITIHGNGLQGLVRIQFDTVNAPFNPTYNTDASVFVYVPQNVKYGPQPINLVNGLGGTAQINFNVIQPAPQIDSIRPLSGNAGDTVTVYGLYFSNISSVLLGAIAAQVIDSSNSGALKIKIPSGVGAGKITITTSGGTAVSTATFSIEKAILIADFDGGGLRGDGNAWFMYGDMTSKTVTAVNPAGPSGNFIKAVPQTTASLNYAGISTYPATSGSQTFGLTKTAANTFLKFDVNSNGYTATQVQVIVEDLSANNYNLVVDVNWTGWQTVNLNLAGFYFGYGTTAQTPATELIPANIKTVKFHFVNYVGNQSEANIDNIRFVE